MSADDCVYQLDHCCGQLLVSTETQTMVEDLSHRSHQCISEQHQPACLGTTIVLYSMQYSLSLALSLFLSLSIYIVNIRIQYTYIFIHICYNIDI